MQGVCYVVGAGAFTTRDLNPREDDYIIAADGGYRSLFAAGLHADLLVGDLDSLGRHPDAGIPVLRYPAEKDDTDMGLAIRAGCERGYRSFMMYGAGGGRIDHFLANIQLMCRYSRMGCNMRLVDEKIDIYAITDGGLMLPRRENGTLASVFCQGDSAEGVTLNGLKYPLDNATLTYDMPLGVSNEYASDGNASVSVEKGTLIVVVEL